MKTFLRDVRIALIAALMLVGGLFTASLFTPELGAQLKKVPYYWALRVIADDTVRVGKQLTVNGKVTTSGTKFATIDSFTTTALLDTVVMSGAAVGDVILVVPMTFTYSTGIDTGFFYSALVLNTDSVVVTRTAIAAGNDGKSAGQFALIRIDK